MTAAKPTIGKLEEISVDEIRRTVRPEPQPWLTPEDAKGWKRIKRERRGPGQMPLIGLELHFDREQSEWIRAEAERTGSSYFDVVKRLVDEARRRDSAA